MYICIFVYKGVWGLRFRAHLQELLEGFLYLEFEVFTDDRV